MTTTELRKLDAWIAEHVMGWLRVNSNEKLDHPQRFNVLPDRILIGQNMGHRIIEYSPTTDPAAAMQVLEKCITGNTSIAINHGTTGWWVTDCDKKKNYAIAETLPLAICLFAKKLFSK
jgi:Phage ABA sandwich domain